MKDGLETGRVDTLRDSGPLGQLWTEMISEIQMVNGDLEGNLL